MYISRSVVSGTAGACSCISLYSLSTLMCGPSRYRVEDRFGKGLEQVQGGSGLC